MHYLSIITNYTTMVKNPKKIVLLVALFMHVWRDFVQNFLICAYINTCNQEEFCTGREENKEGSNRCSLLRAHIKGVYIYPSKALPSSCRFLCVYYNRARIRDPINRVQANVLPLPEIYLRLSVWEDEDVLIHMRGWGCAYCRRINKIPSLRSFRLLHRRGGG
jgi:hypothetical protein